MDHELFLGCDGAACAAADLTARILADLAQAAQHRAVAEARYRAALAAGTPVPLAVRLERTATRRQVDALHQLLDGMPGDPETFHAASA